MALYPFYIAEYPRKTHLLNCGSNLEQPWPGMWTKATHLKIRDFNNEKFLYVGNMIE